MTLPNRRTRLLPRSFEGSRVIIASLALGSIASAPAAEPPAAAASPSGAATAPSPASPQTPSVPPTVPQAPGPVLFVDETAVPKVTLTWPTEQGAVATYTRDLSFASSAGRSPIAPNLEAFVTIGGKRLDTGQGDPRGAILRVGFYKADPRELLFENIADNAVVTITLTGVRFNQQPYPEPETVLLHAQWTDPGGVFGCTPTLAELDLYLTSSTSDDLAGRITSANGRLGALPPIRHVRSAADAQPKPSEPSPAAAAPATGSARGTLLGASAARLESDGSVTLEAAIPYPLLKHVEDPWLRTGPGEFLEPFHFHLEVEILPHWAAGTPSPEPRRPAPLRQPPT